MQTERFRVIGMTSWGCANIIANALTEMGGIRSVTVSYAMGDATVNYDEKITSPHLVKLAVSGAGYGVETGDTIN